MRKQMLVGSPSSVTTNTIAHSTKKNILKSFGITVLFVLCGTQKITASDALSRILYGGEGQFCGSSEKQWAPVSGVELRNLYNAHDLIIEAIFVVGTRYPEGVRMTTKDGFNAILAAGGFGTISALTVYVTVWDPSIARAMLAKLDATPPAEAAHAASSADI